MEDPSCKTARWRTLKSLLNNLEGEDFLQQIQANPEAVVIDVRTRAEFERNHLERAVNIDYLDFDFWDRIEPLDRTQTFFVYCRSGRRSIRTCTLMRNAGFQKVYNLDGEYKSIE